MIQSNRVELYKLLSNRKKESLKRHYKINNNSQMLIATRKINTRIFCINHNSKIV